MPKRDNLAMPVITVREMIRYRFPEQYDCAIFLRNTLKKRLSFAAVFIRLTVARYIIGAEKVFLFAGLIKTLDYSIYFFSALRCRAKCGQSWLMVYPNEVNHICVELCTPANAA